MAQERIQKVLSRAGVASRREAERLLLAGRVSVNGSVVRKLGTSVDPAHDRIEVDTKVLRPDAREPVVLALHKPRRVVTTLSDPEGRPTVRDLLAGYDRRVYPVGRLDWDAEGLVLLTDDGDLAHRLMHPSFEVPRTYRVKVKGRVPAVLPRRLAEGIHLDDGPGRAENVRILSVLDANSWLELTVREGRHHFVKRLLEAHGHPVLRIQRITYGPVTLADLGVGRWRKLNHETGSTAQSPGTSPSTLTGRHPAGGGSPMWRPAIVGCSPPCQRVGRPRSSKPAIVVEGLEWLAGTPVHHAS
ncbi:MAG: rRNA pseudouridine synthase [Deltaproteobacteria bacterium]|nr:rRNA pseudouridine synthase [Deltaproteobacteria bacterium]